MSAIRSTNAVRALTTTTVSTTTRQSMRQFTASARTSASHGPQYDPPTGWLFGVKPGEKYQKEGWENPFFYGFCGSLVLAGVAYGFKPDTSIQTWALEEARRRLEAEGILEDPDHKKK
ncbi:ESSS subunit of NADH:ubiquinone oxidoreductase-domain-containing protein [Astrocystis sublimbata]|nr:ESSS subunit of NADH:ubiquinone oxidoreductase-domain-containing protein [Astrocystis sublimbata]